MKQNGIRLVQRKFAQGVPIPASTSTTVPAPPERKPDAPPKNVYYSNMTCRSLVDMLSMQNIHKHNQEPLVVLERLRADEIPSPVPIIKPHTKKIKKRRDKAENNSMCLRSKKRKSNETTKNFTKKKPKRHSSGSTDDEPLTVYANRPEVSVTKQNGSPNREARAVTENSGSKKADSIKKTSDRGFKFKKPMRPARLSSRLVKKVAAPKKGRKKKAAVALGARLAGLRSARVSQPLMRPRRNAMVLDSKPNVVHPPSKTNRTQDKKPPSIPAQISALTPPPSDDGATEIRAIFSSPPVDKNAENMSDTKSADGPSDAPGIVNRRPIDSADFKLSPVDCISPNISEANTYSISDQKSIYDMVEISETEVNFSNNRLSDYNIANRSPIDSAELKLSPVDCISPNISEANSYSISDQKPMSYMVEIPETEVNFSNNSRKPAEKPTQTKTKMAKPKCGAKAALPEETPQSTRLLRNSREPQVPQPAPNPDVYEFDAELEASRPPSSLRWRAQATPDVVQPAPDPVQPPAQPPVQPAPVQPATAGPAPVRPATRTSPETVEYLDILPNSSHCIEIRPNKQQESGAECVSAKLVPKNEICNKKNLIENLSNSPALLNKFFNCLTAELKTELDNLIAAEGLNQPSTSKEEETYLYQNVGNVYEAPTFYPTAEEFADPIKYYEKIAPQASIYGLCKIVPPEGFTPPCNLSDTMRFAVIYQYISKMYSRWGPVSRELAAINAHLRSQSVLFTRPPLLDGREVNLPKLYHAVERNGGLSNVIQRKRWGRVAEEMKLMKLQHPERKLDPIYMRYLLPYAMLSDQERQNIMAEVEKCWTTKYQKVLERARHPFQRQNRMLGIEGESESDDDHEDGNTAGALHEAEDCSVPGRVMNLVTFKKIAASLMDAHFDPNQQPPSADDVEKAYWRAVLLGTEHIVANTASIDTGEEGYGFPKDPEAEYGTSPWNLKVLARNPNNVLRYLGAVLGVTVPTLHLSMLFSTSCWHRDPHGLPWIEYMHSGADKIWYGIPQDESANFRRAVETLCPAYCQNKSIWLASEITMIPPNILSEHGVKLSRVIQRPGEYVLVFPEAHSCSITTGFGVAESVYFASNAWLSGVYKLFQELRNSCEPTMFSLEQLLLNGSADPEAPPQVCLVLCTLLSSELEHRSMLEQKGLKVQERPASSAPSSTSYFRSWNAGELDECEYCRSTLFLSKVTGLPPQKRSKAAVCSEDAVRLLETKKYRNIDRTTLEYVSSYSTSALEEMLERLESRTSEEADSRAPSVVDLTDPERAESQEQNLSAYIDLSR